MKKTGILLFCMLVFTGTLYFAAQGLSHSESKIGRAHV